MPLVTECARIMIAKDSVNYCVFEAVRYLSEFLLRSEHKICLRNMSSISNLYVMSRSQS